MRDGCCNDSNMNKIVKKKNENKIQWKSKCCSFLEFPLEWLTFNVGAFVRILSDITMNTPKMIPMPAPTQGNRFSSVGMWNRTKWWEVYLRIRNVLFLHWVSWLLRAATRLAAFNILISFGCSCNALPYNSRDVSYWPAAAWTSARRKYPCDSFDKHQEKWNYGIGIRNEYTYRVFQTRRLELENEVSSMCNRSLSLVFATLAEAWANSLLTTHEKRYHEPRFQTLFFHSEHSKLTLRIKYLCPIRLQLNRFFGIVICIVQLFQLEKC